MDMDSIFKTEEEKRLLQMSGSALFPLGMKVVDVDCRLSGRALIRVFVDRMQAEARVTLDDCVVATRTLEPVVESELSLNGAYDFEVSSPGLDRRLRTSEDFADAIGSEVKLALTESLPGLGANVRGTILGLEPGKIKILKDNQEVLIELQFIKKANKIALV